MKQTLAIVTVIAALIWFFAENPSEITVNADRPDSPRPVAVTTQSSSASGQENAAFDATSDQPSSVSAIPSTSQRAPSLASKPDQGVDNRPLPKIPSNRDQHAVVRVIGDHFQSHPSTEQRIWNIRQLAAAEHGDDRSPEKVIPNVPAPDIVDTAVAVKNGAARLGSQIFASLVGPLSIDDEWSAGQKIHEQLLGEFKVDAQASRRVAELGNRMLGAIKRTKGRQFTFTVVNDDQVNAFAHYGGHIYIFKGLLDLAKSDHQIEFVLAHEIAHIELGHCSSAALAGETAERCLGEFAKLPANMMEKLVSLSYSPDNELASDAWAYHTLRARGFSQSQIADFFYLLLEHEERLRNSKIQP